MTGHPVYCEKACPSERNRCGQTISSRSRHRTKRCGVEHTLRQGGMLRKPRLHKRRISWARRRHGRDRPFLGSVVPFANGSGECFPDLAPEQVAGRFEHGGLGRAVCMPMPVRFRCLLLASNALPNLLRFSSPRSAAGTWRGHLGRCRKRMQWLLRVKLVACRHAMALHDAVNTQAPATTAVSCMSGTRVV